jgi:glycosyltransferase involved in cell wall biosynthesis
MDVIGSVTVVIPAYNHATYIGDAIRSVQGCHGVDARILVVDDGSDDATKEVVSSYSDVEYCWQRNQGAHAAINRGIEAASTEFVAILNDDDIYLPGHLHRALLRLAETGAGLSLARPIMFGEGPKLSAMRVHDRYSQAAVQRYGAIFGLLEQNWFVSTSAMVLKRSLWSAVGGFSPYRLAHDVDFVIKCALKGGVSADMVPTWAYRSHGSNASSRISAEQGRAELEVILSPLRREFDRASR